MYSITIKNSSSMPNEHVMVNCPNINVTFDNPRKDNYHLKQGEEVILHKSSHDLDELEIMFFEED